MSLRKLKKAIILRSVTLDLKKLMKQYSYEKWMHFPMVSLNRKMSLNKAFITKSFYREITLAGLKLELRKKCLHIVKRVRNNNVFVFIFKH